MKVLNISSLSYCSLILLFNTVTGIPQALEPSEPSSTVQVSPLEPWYPPRDPSWLLKWSTDPRHAWWRKQGSLIKRNPTPASNQQVALPTKCQYVAANTDPACSSGCICKTSCASIYIWNSTRPDPKPQYHICTNWMLNHKYQLQQGFIDAGFQIVPNRTRCGWQKFTHVSAMRVGRGSIDVNGTVDEQWGNTDELAVIERVMKEEYPFVEILIICATLVGPIFIFFGGVGWCIYADRERKVKYRPLKQRQ